MGCGAGCGVGPMGCAGAVGGCMGGAMGCGMGCLGAGIAAGPMAMAAGPMGMAVPAAMPSGMVAMPGAMPGAMPTAMGGTMGGACGMAGMMGMPQAGFMGMGMMMPNMMGMMGMGGMMPGMLPAMMPGVPGMPGAAGAVADDSDRGPTTQEVADFLAEGKPDERSSRAFRSEPADIQAEVIDRGSLSDCHNPSAALMGRIRDAKLAKKARAGEAFGPETCADWRMGRCDRGDRCRYAHGGRERICPSFPGAPDAAAGSRDRARSRSRGR